MSEGRTTTLGPFPLEIWILVCETLADRISQDPELHYTKRGPASDLKALCRVSKGISAEAERALFRSHHISPYDFYWKGNPHEQGFSRLLRFIRTVLDRPHLLSHVRELTLVGPLVELRLWPALLETYGRLAQRLGFDPTAFPLYSLNGWQMEGVDTVLRRMSSPSWVNLDADGTRRQAVGPEILMFLVIPLLPRLKSLVFTAIKPAWPLPWLDMLGRMSKAGAIKPFDPIVDLRLAWLGFNALDHFVILLALCPNVEKLALWRCNGTGSDEPPFIEQAGAPGFPRNIKTLEMHACVFREPVVRFLLRSCPNLERFVFHAGSYPAISNLPPTTAIQGGNLLTARKILEALQDAKATLKEIDVDITRGWSYHEPGGPLTPADFDDFPVLERARVAHVGEAADDNDADGKSTILSIGDNTAQLGVEACFQECSGSCSWRYGARRYL
ncbi:hypothetical protein PG985_007605 [Apiospora marii]|uniref:F-box domain-containing protein n=1 Tax=Apiospora marii TaxID=335849 RepID=A0ABR1SQG0_9PEZI